MNFKMSIAQNIQHYRATLPEHVTLVAVSKTKPIKDIQEAYNAGQRVFGENKIQEMAVKWEQLPKDIEWHMIGHVQSNKVKYMAPFVSLVHGVDSIKLLKEINKRAAKHDRVIDCLFQIHIAQEATKFGMDKQEVLELIRSPEFKELRNIRIVGLMGMATFTKDETLVESEFKSLKSIFDILKTEPETKNLKPKTLSMGMSGDYKLAINCGSTMVRIGSSIFGSRNY